MIDLTIIKPPNSLSDYVRQVLYIKSNKKTEHFQKVISNPYVYLSFIPNKPPLPIVGDKELPILHNLYFTGPIINENVVLKYSGKIDHIFYEFTPSGFYSLFKISPSTFINNLIPLSHAIAPYINEVLQEQISQTNNLSHQKEIIDQFLLQKSKNSLPFCSYVQKALEIIELHKGYIPINSLVQQVNVGDRQLRRKFKEIVGLSPKTYCEVLNTHYIITCMQTKNHKSIQDLAQNSDYYDLAHFCNRFKKVMGFKPTEFINSDIVDFSKSMYSQQ